MILSAPLIPTDFNRFSAGERAILENHWYILADAALQAHLPKKWKPKDWPALLPPFPEWLGHQGVRRSLFRK